MMNKHTPNRIDTKVTAGDAVAARRKTPAALAKECLRHLELAVPYNTTFTHAIPQEYRNAAGIELKAAFESWANSWIAPKLRQIIAKAKT